MAVESSTGPAAVAAARASRASLALGAAGLAAAALVVARLFESWRVTPTAASHHITVFGLRVTYPTANLGAIVVVVLAATGLVVFATAALALGRELLAARRFDRALARRVSGELDGALVIDDERPRAFCAGLLRPQAYVSSAAAALLDAAALEVVIAHERAHARRRDPLRLATGRVFVSSLFFIPGLGSVVDAAGSLAELSADESAVLAAPGNRAALASAMLAFDDDAVDGHAAGIDPARVDQLLGDSQLWRFPLLVCLGGCAAITLVVATALLAGRVAAGSATLAPPFLSRQPCVVVLAAIPAALALLAVRVRRRAAS